MIEPVSSNPELITKPNGKTILSLFYLKKRPYKPVFCTIKDDLIEQQNDTSVCQPPHQHAHAGNVGDYTIADVYEDAAVIGSELERIISNYGSHVLKELMPKVIGVLELLEQLTLRKERETEQLHECRLRISSLEMEKMQRFNEREKFEKELEEIEEKWKQETLKLIGMVNKLKEENKRLSDTINKNNLNTKQNDQISKL